MSSIHEHCPKCNSKERIDNGIEHEMMLPPCQLWRCLGCGIEYDGPLPPYDDDFATVVDDLAVL